MQRAVQIPSNSLPRTRTRWVGSRSAFTIALGTIVLLVTPIGAQGAAAPTGSIPGHITVQPGQTIHTSGCHHLRTAAPRFHPATMLATWLARAVAADCTRIFQGPGITDEASEAVTLAITIPVKTFLGSAMVTKVQLQWNVTASGNISTAITGVCPNVLLNSTTGDGSQFCEIAAYAGVQVDAYLYDTTNGSTIYGTAAPGVVQVYKDTTNSTYCFDFFCSSSNSTTASQSAVLATPYSDRISLLGTLDHHHHYVVVTTFTAFVETLVTGYPSHGRATANLDLRSGGQGATLGGFSVS